jgi:putative SOS response-associated peptidase YedK
MCNLYSLTTNQEAMRRLFDAEWDRLGNQPPLPGIFPDQSAPILRVGADGRRELVRARWGMPTPPAFLKPGAIDRGVTNIRNVASPHWRRWLQPAYRCLVPATSFSEPSDDPDPATGRKRWAWFALADDRPLFAFAGLWTPWSGVRGTKANPVEGDHQLYGFLTTDPNRVVGAVHTKAMPVILRTVDEWTRWLTAPVGEALAMQRPLPDDALRLVRADAKEDPGPDRPERLGAT